MYLSGRRYAGVWNPSRAALLSLWSPWHRLPVQSVVVVVSAVGQPAHSPAFGGGDDKNWKP